MRSPFLAAAFVLASVAACGQGPENAAADLTLSGVQWRNAEQDANAASARDDTRFIGVFGLAREVPGAPSVSAYEDDGCVRMIEGTSDYQNTGANRRAREYARRYNTQMLKLVSRERGVSVGSASCRANVR